MQGRREWSLPCVRERRQPCEISKWSGHIDHSYRQVGRGVQQLKFKSGGRDGDKKLMRACFSRRETVPAIVSRRQVKIEKLCVCVFYRRI
jgi:hypothetical protein